MMRRLLALLLVVGLAALSSASRVSSGPVARFDWFEYQGRDPVYEKTKVGPDEYVNPILAGFYPDPSIVRVGEDYYLVTSSFAYFPGVPIFHSRDLVHWTQIGHVLDRASQLPLDGLGISRGVFAPTLRYHDGTFYMITTLVDAGGNFFVTAKNPSGPWSDPIWLPEVDGIDPSIFFDDDGKAYVTNNGPPPEQPRYDGHRALWIQEFDVRTQKLVGPRAVIVNGGVDVSRQPIWIEGPHIFNVKGVYYLIAAEGGTGDQHSQVVFKSSSPLGPYQPFSGNPILTQRHLNPARPNLITSTGHVDFVETPKGDWWAVFLGCRPYADDLYNTGRETFLMPVRWIDGWPIVTRRDEVVPYIRRRPSLPRQSPGPVPMSGNLAVREEFDGSDLAPYWVFIRTPKERWYDLKSTPGSLSIRGRPAAFEAKAQPSFIGRRQQHAFASASVAMRFAPARAGDAAGLMAFQNDDYFFFLGVTLDDGKPVLRLEQRAGPKTGGTSVVLASTPLSERQDAPIYLKIDARGGEYNFSYALEPNEWIVLKAGADGTILSTKVAGGFVGTMLGMYAHAAE